MASIASGVSRTSASARATATTSRTPIPRLPISTIAVITHPGACPAPPRRSARVYRVAAVLLAGVADRRDGVVADAPRHVQQVVGAPRARALRVRVVRPAGVEVRGARAGVADPVRVDVGRDDAAEMGHVEEDGLGAGMGAVLVAGHHDSRDLVVERVLTD